PPPTAQIVHLSRPGDHAPPTLIFLPAAGVSLASSRGMGHPWGERFLPPSPRTKEKFVRQPVRFLGWLAVAAWAGAAVLPASADDKPANPLDPLDALVGGAWVGKGKGPTKGDFRTKVVYRWGINRRVLKARSYLVGDKGEQLVYESVFTWHPG